MYADYCFVVSVLPVDRPAPDDDAEDVTLRVQTAIAKSLNLAQTKHTSSDKVEYTKRKFFVPAAAGVCPCCFGCLVACMGILFLH